MFISYIHGMLRPTISAIIRQYYNNIEGKLRKQFLLYITIQTEIIILLYQRRNNKIFKMLQCMNR